MNKYKEEIKICFPRNERGIAIPINIDIDGTIIMHGYDLHESEFVINGNAPSILRRWVEKYNCTINIYTTRDGEKKEEVIRLFNRLNIPFDNFGGDNQQDRWTTSRKQYGFVIDDMSSTKVNYDENGYAYVDWDYIIETFEPRLEHIKHLIDEIEEEESVTKSEEYSYANQCNE